VKIRFQADADLKHAIVAGTLRRAASLDFRRAEAVPLEGLNDATVLAVAAVDSRVLVSHDVNTMEWHFREFVQKQTSPGLILIPQERVGVGQAIEGLVLLWEVLDAADMENRVCLFPSLVIY
jgi:hypothetical protein